jgi:hypothetical protein
VEDDEYLDWYLGSATKIDKMLECKQKRFSSLAGYALEMARL